MTIHCPDCNQSINLPSGHDGTVHCLSYLHADGRVRVASTRAESVAVYRTVLDETRAVIERRRG